MHEQSPSDMLAERISDLECSRAKLNADDAARWDKMKREMHAFNCAGLRAIAAVKSAAQAGNVQCRHAEMEIDAFLSIVFQKDTHAES